MDSFLKTGKLSKEDVPKGTSSKEAKPVSGPRPWVEKYRPRTVDDVIEQSEIVSVLKQVQNYFYLTHAFLNYALNSM